MKWFLSLLSLSFGALSVIAESVPKPAPFSALSFYELRPVKGPTDAGGRLTAEQWKAIPEASLPYVYWKTVAESGELQSTMQMAYTAAGLYMRVRNHEPQMAQIAAKVITRGDPYLWKDDCLQLYFDPACSGIGYLAFTVNALGMQDDRKQLDGAVSLDDWQGENWQVWATREPEAWVIEAFFPYSDLESAARPGDLWMANTVRYGYATGNFKGISWSLGGSYALPGRFGYLYFGKETPATADEVAQILQARVAPPWSLQIGSEMLRYSAEAGREIIPVERLAAEAQRQKEWLIGQIHTLPGGSPEAAKQVEEAVARPADAEALASLTRLYWREKIRILVDETTPPILSAPSGTAKP